MQERIQYCEKVMQTIIAFIALYSFDILLIFLTPRTINRRDIGTFLRDLVPTIHRSNDTSFRGYIAKTIYRRAWGTSSRYIASAINFYSDITKQHKNNLVGEHNTFHLSNSVWGLLFVRVWQETDQLCPIEILQNTDFGSTLLERVFLQWFFSFWFFVRWWELFMLNELGFPLF